jgi:hypothetical protein
MNQKLFYSLILIIGFSVNGFGCCINQYSYSKNQDSLGINMPVTKFDSLVEKMINKFSTSSTKSIEDYIVITRIVNTIAFEWLFDKKKDYEEIYNMYHATILKDAVKITNAKLSKGMSYYSRKYDLQIGGSKTKNNFYELIY